LAGPVAPSVGVVAPGGLGAKWGLGKSLASPWPGASRWRAFPERVEAWVEKEAGPPRSLPSGTGWEC
jgi:hypothetical protein